LGISSDNLSTERFDKRYYEKIRQAGALSRDIGRVALSGSQLEELAGYERRQYDEMASGLAEALQGNVRTHYTFDLVDGKLVAEDNQPIEQLMEQGINRAYGLANQDNFYKQFVPQRAEHELNEFRKQQDMTTGRTDYNTIITFSPYSEEFDTSPESRAKLVAADQKPYWQRAMVRVSHWDGQKLHIYTRSIDNSDVSLLKETAAQTLFSELKATNSTDMLGEQITRKLPAKMCSYLADVIVGSADEILAARHGGEWHQGRPVQEAADLQAFVESQSEVVMQLINSGRQLALEHGAFDSYKQAFNQKVYDYVALLEARLSYAIHSPIVDIEAASSAAGELARSEGKVYDMCGLVLKPDNQSLVGTQTGFESLLRLQGKKIQCPECRHQVVVQKSELAAGKLACPDCGYGVDVCTGQRFNKKPTKPAAQPKTPGFVELLTQALSEHARQPKSAKT